MKSNIKLREVTYNDKEAFLLAVQESQSFHAPWVTAPSTVEAFDYYFKRCEQSQHKGYILCDALDNILGIFNLNEIVYGVFQNAYLGFYTMVNHAGQGYMSAGIKLLLHQFFNVLGLHRLEANIQPENNRSIHLVKNNGFRYEGYSPHYLKINNIWQGHEHWAITHEDFASLKIREDTNNQ